MVDKISNSAGLDIGTVDQLARAAPIPTELQWLIVNTR